MPSAPFLIALLFAPLAGAIAYVITYAEYAKHFIDRRRVGRRALEAGLIAFAFFLIVPPLLIVVFLRP